MSLSPEERSWIWKLDITQCREVLDQLQITHEGVNNIVSLRGMLAKYLPEKNKVPEFREIIKQLGADITLQHDKLTLKRWVVSLEEEECISYLREKKLLVTGNLAELRQRFSRFLTELSCELVKPYLELARCYVESLVHRSLQENDEKFEVLLAPEPVQTIPVETVTSHGHGNQVSDSDDVNSQDREPNHEGENILIQRQRIEQAHNQGNISRHQPLAFSSPNRSNLLYRNPNISKGDLMDKVRKWQIKFNGSGKPQEAMIFLESIEQNARNYEIPKDLLPELITECLTDKASEWFRNNKEDWSTWDQFTESFKVFFIPNRARTQLENEVHRFYQNNQTIRDYALSMQSLMRFIPDFSKKRQLDWIYQNLHPEYKTYIRPNDFTSLVQLIALGEEFERNQMEVKRLSSRFPRKTFLVEEENAEDIYDRKTHCWNCGKIGHMMRNCKEPKKLVCSYCRRENVATSKCNCTGARRHRTYMKTNQRPDKKPSVTSLLESNSKTCDCGKQSTEVETDELQNGNNTSMSQITEAFCVNIDPRPHINISIYGKQFSALLDTGATSSYINSATAKFIEAQGIIPRHISAKTTLANGTSSELSSVYWIEMICDGVFISHDLMRLDGMSCDVLFGVDILQKLSYNLQQNRTMLSYQLCSIVDRSHLSAEEENKLNNLIQLELTKFENLPQTSSAGIHVIKMKTDTPFRQRYYPRNPCMKEVINVQIDELLSSGQIEKSDSPYSSPLVLVRKKDGSWRMCVDFRQLNEKSEQDAYPMPHIQPILNRLRTSKYISTIDLKNGYWQIPIREDCRKFTAFAVPGRGLFQWKVMPFGLHSAPATFQRILDQVISHDLEEFAIAYLDDIVIFSESFEEHLIHLTQVFERLLQAQLRINTTKSRFCKHELQYLGHIIGNGGIKTDPEKIRAIKEYATPSSVKEVRRFVAMASWYRNFIPNFSEIVAPLTQLTHKNEMSRKFLWTDNHQLSFDALKNKMISTPVLSCPDFSIPFLLQTDASDIGLGAVLFQRENDQEKIISFSSRKLTDREQKYSTTEKECLAIVWAIQKHQQYLEGYEFTVITDHIALKWLLKIENPKGRLARWIMQLQQYKFLVEYRKGNQNVVPDALSRSPVDSKNDPELEFTAIVDIPKKQTSLACKWYNKKFEEVTKYPEKNPDFTIMNEHLFRHSANADLTEDSWKLCVSKPLREKVLNENHSEPTAGHLGTRKTVARIGKNYYWPGMSRDISKFISKCKVCLEYKVPQIKPAGYMHTLHPEHPWEVVCIDFVGPLPRSTKGCKYILVAQDKLTKWVELKCLSTPTTSSVKNMLRNQIFSKFGWPRIIISDNGSQFTSTAFKTFLSEQGICHQYTPKYSPQCNAVERTNRVIKTMIASFTRNKSHRKWDEFIPEIEFAYNTSHHEATGFSPSQLNFGRELKQPKTVVDECGVKLQRSDKSEELSMKIAETIELARQNLKKASATQSKYYNLRRRSWFPEIGDEVYTKEHQISSAPEAFNAKLAAKFSGPFKIIDFVSPTVVRILECQNLKAKPITVHIKDLKQIPESK